MSGPMSDAILEESGRLLFDERMLKREIFLYYFSRYSYESDQVDMYDPRRRIWYNQAIMSPKDVIIAVDMSGSMTGNIPSV